MMSFYECEYCLAYFQSERQRRLHVEQVHEDDSDG